MRNPDGELPELTRRQIQNVLTAKTEEYKAVRAEIVQNLASQHQLITVAVTLIGVMTAASGVLIEAHAGISFAIFSFGAFGLVWLQLRYARSNMALLDYLAKEFRPSYHEWLRRLGPDASLACDDVFRAETVIRVKGYASEAAPWEYPLEASRYLITLLAANVSFLVYLRSSSWALTSWAVRWGLLILEVVFTLYTLFAILKARQSFLDRPEPGALARMGWNTLVESLEQQRRRHAEPTAGPPV